MKTGRILIIAAVAALALACKKNNSESVNVTVPSFAKGADVSWSSEMKADGKQFRKQDGTVADLMEVLKDVGVNAIRLRVWVNPANGWSGKNDVVALAKSATQAGLPVMIDFHYSDFFADPSRQTVPDAWKADTGDLDKMAAHVADHTTEVLQALKDAGVKPAWIQIGNETRAGMVYPTGQLYGSGAGGWDGFARLYRAGYGAAKAVFPEAKVMPHLPNAYDDNAWWFRELQSRGGQFDMIALSHYPQAESKYTATEYNTKALNSIIALNAEFKVPVMISEVGVKTNSNEATAAEVLSNFMKGAKALGSKCAGVFYWEPEVYGWWKPSIYQTYGWNAYDQGAFTSDGRPSSVMNCFKD